MAELLPTMTPNEIVVLTSFYTSSRSYVEFGCGGSTLLAANAVAEQVVTVDSDLQWLTKVETACDAAGSRLHPQTCFVDIGPTRGLGYPADDSMRADWPLYYERVWSLPGAVAADLYLVDGRFRLACVLQILLRASPDALIMVHDYATRPHYHPAGQFARELCRVDDLVVFQRRLDYDPAKAAAVMLNHRFDTR